MAFGRGKVTESSYEETEGLLINLGVVAALMLSFVVGVFFTIPREEFFFGDYRDQIMFNTDFRLYAEAMLDFEGFNFTKPFPAGTGYELVNIREVMHRVNDGSYSCELGEPEINCNRLYSDIQIVAELTEKSFPSEYLYSYCVYHINECTLPSDILITTGGYAVTALTIALFISVVFYISLALSDIREEADGGNLAPLEKFRKVTTTVTMLGFFLLLVGVIVFFLGLVRVVRVRSPLDASVNQLILINMYLMLVPSGIFFTVIAILLPRYALHDGDVKLKSTHTGSKITAQPRVFNSDDENGSL